ncbi:hypothetical protein EMIT040CA3_40106 [Bacillus pseudomycoides]
MYLEVFAPEPKILHISVLCFS